MPDVVAADPQRLSAELEALSLRALRREYVSLNHGLFGGRLRLASLALVDLTHTLGRWIGHVRRIELSRRLLMDHDWGTVVEVLKHEMAHQYVDEILARREEAPHGASFRQICAERGIDARPTGLPEPRGDARERSVLQRVMRLLALAQSANENEARSAMAAAQRLMLKHNLDAPSADAAQEYGFRHLGKPTGRVHESQHMLALILTDHFFVDVIWVPVWRPLEGKRGSVLEICGTAANLEIAAYAHDFLMRTAERLWKEHRQAHGIRSNRDRMAFQAGVMSGFRDRLVAEQEQHQAAGLIWLGDSRLRGYMKRRHPHVRTVRRGTSSATAAHRHGREAGARIVLHKGVSAGPSNQRRRLPSG